MSQVITKFKADTDQYNRKVKEAKSCLDQVGASGKQTGQILGQFDSIMGTSIGTLGKLSVATAAVSAALKVAKDAFMSCEGNIDAWGRTVESGKAAYEVLTNTINNGNWSDFFTNIGNAITDAQELYNMFDLLGSTKLNNSVPIAILKQKLAELRVLKQQGKDVDEQIKSLSSSLAKLQKEEVTVGKGANREGWIDTVKHAGGNEGYAKHYWERYKKEGQSFYKWASQEVEKLGKKIKTTTVSTSAGAVTQTVNTMTGTEQKKYNTLKAIVDRETALQKYQAGYTESVNEETGIFQGQYRYNRMANSGGGNHSGENNSGKTEIQSTVTVSQDDVDKEMNKIYTSLYEWGLKWGDQLSKGMSDALATSTKPVETIEETANKGMDAINAQVSGSISEAGGKIAQDAADMNAAWQGTASLIATAGSAMQQFGNKGMDVAGAIAETIATIALSYAQNLAGDTTTKGNIWAFIAAAAAATVSLATTIASIHNSTGYAQGGIIPGADTGGRDSTYAYVSPGEVILNKAQQRNLASQLGTAGGGGGNSYVTGEQLVTVINAYGKRTGRGEILK